MTPAPRCPVCDGAELVDVLRRDWLPIMQNVVWPTREEARSAPGAPFVLAVCARCGFAFNRVFDVARMVYDARYDNDVPSAVFTAYYADIARDLATRHDLAAGPVFDVGCGKGTFLDVLTATLPGTRGVGVDPTCTPRAGRSENPVELVRDLFRAEQVTERPSLVVCRHVLEHIARPVAMIRAVVEGLRADASVPLFFEVPDLAWIIANGAFWDFCYEHCNYFTQPAFAYALALGGVTVSTARTAFGAQYQHAEGRCSPPNSTPALPGGVSDSVASLVEYGRAEAARIAAARARIIAARHDGPCVLWGMATKGVVFANLVDPDATLLAGGIDVNVKKQGRFIPGSAHGIHPPAWLSDLGGEPTVFIMNTNYDREIRAQCDALGVRARFESA